MDKHIARHILTNQGMSTRERTIPSKTKTCTSIQMKLVFGHQQLFQPATTSNTTTGEQQRAQICHEQHNISETQSKHIEQLRNLELHEKARTIDLSQMFYISKQHSTANYIKCEPEEIPLKSQNTPSFTGHSALPRNQRNGNLYNGG